MSTPQLPYVTFDGLTAIANRQIVRDFQAIQSGWPVPKGGTYYVAPSNTTDNNKAHADLVLTGVDDQELINQFISASPEDDSVMAFFEGTVNTTGMINPNADRWSFRSAGSGINYVTINFAGPSSAYESVETFDTDHVAYCLFGLQAGFIEDLRIVGDIDSEPTMILVDMFSAAGPIRLSRLEVGNLDYLIGGIHGTLATGCVFEHILNTTPGTGF